MDSLIVRPALPGDFEALARLYREFHEYHVRGVPAYLCSLGEPTESERQRLFGLFATIVGGPDSALLVAETGGEIIGLAEVYIRQDAPSPATVPHKYGYLQSLAVTESRRHAGIGTALVAAAEDWVRKQGLDEMQLEVWEFPGGPLLFYEKLGYHTLKRKLVKPFS